MKRITKTMVLSFCLVFVLPACTESGKVGISEYAEFVGLSEFVRRCDNKNVQAVNEVGYEWQLPKATYTAESDRFSSRYKAVLGGEVVNFNFVSRVKGFPVIQVMEHPKRLVVLNSNNTFSEAVLYYEIDTPSRVAYVFEYLVSEGQLILTTTKKSYGAWVLPNVVQMELCSAIKHNNW